MVPGVFVVHSENLFVLVSRALTLTENVSCFS